MGVYRVTFVQNYVYQVNASNEDEAYDAAYNEYHSEMHIPVAHTHYDDLDVECLEEDEDEDDEDDDWDD